MIKAIYFDFDGVLTTDKYGFYTTAKYFKDNFNIEQEEFSKCYSKHTKEFDIKPLSFDGVWDNISKCLGVDIHIEHLHKAFLSTPKNEKMLELVNSLRDKYKTGIITDNKKDRFDMLIKEWNLENIFDTLILSADVGAEKNEEKIFDVALQSLNVSAKEAIFIDNTQKNVDMANKVGINGIYFDDETNDINQLKNQLIDLGIKL